MLKRAIALELAYQRHLGHLEKSDDFDGNRENEARKWAEDHYRDEGFIESAEKIIELL